MSGIYPVAARVYRPWKNGGGTTAEILCWPAGAGFDDFTLRLSTARVSVSGAFSNFAGVDRVLTVLEGGPMGLHLGGRDHLVELHAPFAFAGDLPCRATVGAPLLDFNVMTRRPLQARVAVGSVPHGARFALLLAPVAGLARLDLVDLIVADAALVQKLASTTALWVTLTGA